MSSSIKGRRRIHRRASFRINPSKREKSALFRLLEEEEDNEESDGEHDTEQVEEDEEEIPRCPFKMIDLKL